MGLTKVVIDFSVLTYAMTDSLAPLMSTPSYLEASETAKYALITSVVAGQMQAVSSLMFMGEERPEHYNLIFVKDTKVDGEYWRHSYLLREDVAEARANRIMADYEGLLETHLALKRADEPYTGRKPRKPAAIKPIAYKGGRKELTAFHSMIRVVMSKEVERQGWTVLSAKGYEADDLAAALVHLNAGKDLIWLLTIDTDWLGLVSDNVKWFCTSGHQPRVRGDIKQINVWSQQRFKLDLETPRAIWDYKALVGDTSDNLPYYSPLEVIDLLAPPEEFCLWLDPNKVAPIQAALVSERDDACYALDAMAYMNKLRVLGIRLCINSSV
jgi:hypothetical protein